MMMTKQETAAVLAGLRALQGAYNRAELDDILTNGGDFEPLTADAIDELCERLNLQPTTPNLVVLTIEGGILQAVNADRRDDVRVVRLDFDVDGETDHPSLYTLTSGNRKETAYVDDYGIDSMEPEARRWVDALDAKGGK